MKTKLIGLSLLIGACVLPAATLAQDNSDPVGTWFSAQGPNPYVWVFHAGGTLEGFDALALASVFAGGLPPDAPAGAAGPPDGEAPPAMGLQTNWFGDWEQRDDGSIWGYAIKFGSEGPEIPGRFSSITQATINFTPADGTLMICVEQTTFEDQYDATDNDPANLPQVETCTPEFEGLAVVTMQVRRLVP